MSDLDQILTEIDTLSADELERLYQHIAKRRQARYWLVSGEVIGQLRDIMAPVHAQASRMSDTEIDALIDEALYEVRHERRNPPDSRD